MPPPGPGASRKRPPPSASSPNVSPARRAGSPPGSWPNRQPAPCSTSSTPPATSRSRSARPGPTTTEQTIAAAPARAPGSAKRSRPASHSWRLRHHIVRHEAASDGCFPLITNDPALSPAEALAAYKYQPNLERRNHCLKGTQAVAPVNLHTPARIEALLCCHFFALLIHALIERQIRAAMAAAGTTSIPLYAEARDCTAPSARRILEIFDTVTRHHISRDGRIVQVFDAELDARQRQVLKLLGIPASAYRAS